MSPVMLLVGLAAAGGGWWWHRFLTRVLEARAEQGELDDDELPAGGPLLGVLSTGYLRFQRVVAVAIVVAGLALAVLALGLF